VRRLQGGSIVDAVAGDCDDFSLLTQEPDDPEFLGGADARVDGDGAERIVQFIIAHRLQGAAGPDLWAVRLVG